MKSKPFLGRCCITITRLGKFQDAPPMYDGPQTSTSLSSLITFRTSRVTLTVGRAALSFLTG